MCLDICCVVCCCFFVFFFFMIRRPPRSTQSRSSAASDVYKRQFQNRPAHPVPVDAVAADGISDTADPVQPLRTVVPVSYTHLRAHETVLDLVCRLLLEKKKYKKIPANQLKSKLYPQHYTYTTTTLHHLTTLYLI